MVNTEKQLSRVQLIEDRGELFLVCDAGANSKQTLKLALSFIKDRKYHRSSPSVQKELIAKACGWHLGYRKILDLTAGLGVDAIFLARVGFEVVGLERHPFLFQMLERGLQEARCAEPNQKLWQKLHFIKADAKEYLTQNLTRQKNLKGEDKGVFQNKEDQVLPEDQKFPETPMIPDAIYYDPMFPGTSKTALPTKEMQILRQLIGEDEADPSVVELALQYTQKIVVVKRPLKAPLVYPNPHRVYRGQQIRFDIYQK